MKKIPLTPSGFAIVDDEAYERLAKFKWHSNGRYATRGKYLGKTPDGKYAHTTVKMHREILDAPAGIEVDHINHDRLDNRRCNLRLATRKQNMANSPLNKKNTSGYKGVTYSPTTVGNAGRSRYRVSSPWMARIGYEGKRIFIGIYKTKEQAAKAYNDKAIELFGEFANLNKIGENI